MSILDGTEEVIDRIHNQTKLFVEQQKKMRDIATQISRTHKRVCWFGSDVKAYTVRIRYKDGNRMYVSNISIFLDQKYDVDYIFQQIEKHLNLKWENIQRYHRCPRTDLEIELIK